MNKLSKLSAARLATCHPLLIQIVNIVLEETDVSVTCGMRTKAEQDAAFAAGNSSVRYPNSKHNSNPSMAVDLTIYHHKFKSLWGDDKHLAAIAKEYGKPKAVAYQWFYMQYAVLNEQMKDAAARFGVTLRWGGKWSSDADLLGINLVDIFHWEIVNVAATPVGHTA